MLRWIGFFLLCLMPMAHAQVNPNGPGCPTNNLPCVAISTTANTVQGTFSASLSGFAPSSVGTPIAATTSGVTGTLPAGAVVVATNTGNVAAYCALGSASSTSQQYIAPSGGWFAFTVGAATQMTCLTASSSTTVNMVGGSGLPTGTGGGGGGGGGGAITVLPISYSASTSVSIATTSNTLVAGGTYTHVLLICTLPASTTNVWLNPTGATAAVGTGIMIAAGHGCVDFGGSALPLPTAAITAITDGASAQTVTLAGG